MSFLLLLPLGTREGSLGFGTLSWGAVDTDFAHCCHSCWIFFNLKTLSYSYTLITMKRIFDFFKCITDDLVDLDSLSLAVSCQGVDNERLVSTLELDTLVSRRHEN